MSNDNVRFRCPFCGRVSEGSSRYIGTEDNCPSCGQRFRLKPVSGTSDAELSAFGCYLGMFRRYVGFRGRTCRREFWWAFLLNLIATFVFAIIDHIVFGEYDQHQGLVMMTYFIVSFLPFWALHVRRLHDTNKSGWWAFLVLMPILNIAYIVWMVSDGDVGGNRFGEDPRLSKRRKEGCGGYGQRRYQPSKDDNDSSKIIVAVLAVCVIALAVCAVVVACKINREQIYRSDESNEYTGYQAESTRQDKKWDQQKLNVVRRMLQMMPEYQRATPAEKRMMERAAYEEAMKY